MSANWIWFSTFTRYVYCEICGVDIIEQGIFLQEHNRSTLFWMRSSWPARCRRLPSRSSLLDSSTWTSWSESFNVDMILCHTQHITRTEVKILPAQAIRTASSAPPAVHTIPRCKVLKVLFEQRNNRQSLALSRGIIKGRAGERHCLHRCK